MADLDLKKEDIIDEPVSNEDSSPEDAAAKKKEIVSNVQKKIDAGEKTQENYPKWLRDLTKPKVIEDDLKKKHFEEFENNQKSKQTEDEQEKSKKAFEVLNSQIPADTPQETLDKIDEILADQAEKNEPVDKALEFAMYSTGIPSNRNAAIRQGIKISRKGLMAKGDHVEEKKTDKETKEKATEDKYMNNLPKKFQSKKE